MGTISAEPAVVTRPAWPLLPSGPDVTATPPVDPAKRFNVPGGRVALVVAVVASLVSVWSLVGHQAGHAVSVTYGTVDCHGAKARMVEGSGDAPATPTIWPRAGMRCTLEVQVSNEGIMSAAVTQTVLPQMGPAGKAAVQVSRLGDAKPAAKGTDAVFNGSMKLAPGDKATLRIVFTYREGACSDPQPLTVRDLPELSIRAAGVNSAVTPAGQVVFRGTHGTRCAG